MIIAQIIPWIVIAIGVFLALWVAKEAAAQLNKPWGAILIVVVAVLCLLVILIKLGVPL